MLHKPHQSASFKLLHFHRKLSLIKQLVSINKSVNATCIVNANKKNIPSQEFPVPLLQCYLTASNSRTGKRLLCNLSTETKCSRTFIGTLSLFQFQMAKFLKPSYHSLYIALQLFFLLNAFSKSAFVLTILIFLIFFFGTALTIDYGKIAYTKL